ncbi:MAG: hypothetical protein HYZ42_13695 [Bacteroidetes bacterium]|nr:hypothetical protein [Bacteroidota bacterium]
MSKTMILIFFLLVKYNLMFAQNADVYKNKLPEFLEKRNTSGLIRLVKDSIILQADVEIGKFRKIQVKKKGSLYDGYVVYQKNGKPIGDIFIKNPAKGIATVYADKDGVSIDINYKTSVDEYEMLVFMIKYYIQNKYL